MSTWVYQEVVHKYGKKNMEKAEASKEDLSPKNDSLKEPDTIFRKVFGIVSKIQKDIPLKTKVESHKSIKDYWVR